MLPAIASSAYGMRYATLRLEASALKAATVSLKGTAQTGDAKAPHVHLVVHVDQASATLAARAPSRATETTLNLSPAWMAAYDAEIGSAGGLSALPGTDPLDAMLEQVSAKNAFIANARGFEAAQAMVKRLFELVDQPRPAGPLAPAEPPSPSAARAAGGDAA